MPNPLVEFVYDEYQKGIEIMRRKNADYAGQNGGAWLGEFSGQKQFDLRMRGLRDGDHEAKAD